MSDKEILVSVIVPVYNVEEYIEHCIESIINQTYKNIELILVNDGSSDKSPEICDKYAKLDSRIKVIHKNNGGPSSAREAGVKASVGDYVMLVDGDDWVDPSTVSSCVDVINNHNGIGCVIYSYMKERENGTEVKHIFDTDKNFLQKEEFQKEVYVRLFGLANSQLSKPEGLDYLTSCCMKLYRKDLLSDINYVDIKDVGSGEDGIFGIYALKNCESAIYLDKPFYHYRANTASVTSTYRPQLVSQWSNLFGIMQEYIECNHLPEIFQEALNNRVALGVVGIGLNGLASNSLSFFSFKKYVDSYIKSNIYRRAVKTIKISKLPIAWRFILFFSKYKISFVLCLGLKGIMFLKSKM